MSYKKNLEVVNDFFEHDSNAMVLAVFKGILRKRHMKLHGHVLVQDLQPTHDDKHDKYRIRGVFFDELTALNIKNGLAKEKHISNTRKIKTRIF